MHHVESEVALKPPVKQNRTTVSFFSFQVEKYEGSTKISGSLSSSNPATLQHVRPQSYAQTIAQIWLESMVLENASLKLCLPTPPMIPPTPGMQMIITRPPRPIFAGFWPAFWSPTLAGPSLTRASLRTFRAAPLIAAIGSKGFKKRRPTEKTLLKLCCTKIEEGREPKAPR